MEAENDIDTETLQAQIDLSMAYAEELVASWVKPLARASSSASAKARAPDAEKELEALLRRPPRLGVGAPLPESSVTAVTGREAVRLKHKLEGKKRVRGGADEGVPVAAGKPEDGSDEEESRVGAIRKKARLDPFALPGGKKKGKGNQQVQEVSKNGDPAAGPSGHGGGAVDGAAAAAGGVEGAEGGDDDDGMDVDDQPADAQSPEHRKKRKRKKKKKDGVVVPPSETTNTSDRLLTPPPVSILVQLPPTPALPASPIKSPMDKLIPKLSPSKLLLPDTPILNLSGPPPPIADNANVDASPKKKRHRKKKKKNRAADGEPGGDEPEV
ncbi:hypothetical protein FA95DRAFT_1598547 [Auriscalpium vulgare]|uniref:Uncharacterized protein n=1 Tax=Auriscalpium vulgare TaxID=40419 RepID=A0ACB8REF4_9AGAM|nr:hypothetical protein FA95DRAFT_1598547 [Auriscalpium vulgare]